MKKILLTLAVMGGSFSQAQVSRQVLIEEFTGTWCVNCPDGHAILKSITDANPGLVNVVGMHEGDQFTIPYVTYFDNAFQVGGYPRAGVDRFTYPSGNAFIMSRSYWAGATAARLNVTSPVSINIAPSYNSSTRELVVKVDYTFQAAFNQETRLTCVLLEDSIIANQTGGGANYVHMDVCRAILSADNWGDANHPATVTAGSSYSKTYTYTVPSNMNDNHLRVVAFINKKVGATPVHSTGTEVLNSGQAVVYKAPLSVEPSTESSSFTVGPNPFQSITVGQFQLEKTSKVRAYITNISGQMVNELSNETRVAGTHRIVWGGTTTDLVPVPHGLYLFNLEIDGKRYSKQILFQ